MTGNPYAGPRSLADAEHPHEKIWGRDREIAELADLLIADRIVLVYSPSGAGKTSLLQAGLVPLLRDRRFQPRPPIRVGAEVPPGITLEKPENRYTLSALLSLEEALPKEQKTPVEELARMTLARYLGDDPARELLIFDQFEEALTADPLDVEGRAAFFEQLGEALRSRNRWAIFAMREDYLGPLDRYRKHLPTRLSHSFRLDLLKKDMAVEAVVGPAQAAGVAFAAAAAWKLVENLSAVTVDDEESSQEGKLKSGAGEYVEPVQLQVVCHRLWETLSAGADHIGVDQIGDLQSVDDALAEYYADTVRKAARESTVPEGAIRSWVGRLITDREPPTRRQISRADEVSRDVIPALKPLRDRYLIRSEKRLGQVWYELCHDRLIRPVLADNERETPELERRAAMWASQNQEDGLLLGGDDLERLEPQYATATKPAKQFWDRSRQRRNRRIFVWLLEALVFTGVAVSLYFAVQNRRAARLIEEDNLKLKAGTVKLEQEIAAHEESDRKLGQSRDEAAHILTDLDDKKRVAASTVLAMEAMNRRAAQPDLAGLLSVEAWNQSRLPNSWSAIYQLAHSNPRWLGVLRHSSVVNDMVFGPNNTLAVALSDGSVGVWNLTRRTILRSPPQASPMLALAFGPTGVLVSGDGEGRLHLWNGDTLRRLSPPVKAHDGRIAQLQFDPGGRVLLSAGGHALRFWRVEASRIATTPPEDRLPASIAVAAVVESAGFSLVARTAVATDRNGSAYRWNLDAPERLPTLAVPHDARAATVGNSSGDLFAITSSGVERVDKAGSRKAPLIGGLSLETAGFSDDMSVLALGKAGGSIGVCTVVNGRCSIRTELGGSGSDLGRVRLRGDGGMLASTGQMDSAIWLWDVHEAPPVVPTTVFNEGLSGVIEAVQRSIFDSASHWLLTTADGDRNRLLYYALSGGKMSLKHTIPLRTQPGRAPPLAATIAPGGAPVLAVPEVVNVVSLLSPDLLHRYAKIDVPGVETLAFSHDGKWLATFGSSRPQLQLFSVIDPRRPRRVMTNPALEPRNPIQFYKALAFSPARNLLAVGGDRPLGDTAATGVTVNLWDIADSGAARLVAMLPVDADRTQIAFSPDGATLVTVSRQSIQVWDVPEPGAQPREIFPRFTNRTDGDGKLVEHAIFSSDGSVIAFAENTPRTYGGPALLGNRIYLVDSRRGNPFGDPLDFGHPVDVIGFQPDGKALFLWSTLGIERMSLDPEEWARNLCARANRNLTRREWDAYVGGSFPYARTCPNLPDGEGATSQPAGKPR